METQILPRYEKLADAELRQPDDADESDDMDESEKSDAAVD